MDDGHPLSTPMFVKIMNKKSFVIAFKLTVEAVENYINLLRVLRFVYLVVL